MITPETLKKLEQAKTIEAKENDVDLVRAMCLVSMYYHISPDDVVSMPIERFQILYSELIHEIERKQKFWDELFKNYWGKR